MSVPKSFSKLQCQELTTDFKRAAKVVTVDTPELKSGQILIKNRYVGINASDINATAGRYFNDGKVPFDLGFETVSEVVKVAPDVTNVKVGQAVGSMGFGAFSEYMVAPAATAIPLPDAKPEFVSLMVSGLTAAIALDKVGEVKSSDTVLVTAAAGGTGQYAVQWCKAKGCKVFGTCSSPEKVEFLKKIGCDRPINYKVEDVGEVLKKECPNGIDVVYETIGGKMFEDCVQNIAQKGRIVLIGIISGYKDGNRQMSPTMAELPTKLLTKSASVKGFLLFHFNEDIPSFMQQLITLLLNGKIQAFADMGESTGRRFNGIEDISRAVDYLYSMKSIGKIVVELNSDTTKL